MSVTFPGVNVLGTAILFKLHKDALLEEFFFQRVKAANSELLRNVSRDEAP